MWPSYLLVVVFVCLLLFFFVFLLSTVLCCPFILQQCPNFLISPPLLWLTSLLFLNIQTTSTTCGEVNLHLLLPILLQLNLLVILILPKGMGGNHPLQLVKGCLVTGNFNDLLPTQKLQLVLLRPCIELHYYIWFIFYTGSTILCQEYTGQPCTTWPTHVWQLPVQLCQRCLAKTPPICVLMYRVPVGQSNIKLTKMQVRLHVCDLATQIIMNQEVLGQIMFAYISAVLELSLLFMQHYKLQEFAFFVSHGLQMGLIYQMNMYSYQQLFYFKYIHAVL